MKPGNQRLLEILLEQFIEELKFEDKCTCRECLGGQIYEFLNWVSGFHQ